MSDAVVRVLVEGREAYLYGDGRVIYPAVKAVRTRRRYDERRHAIGVPVAVLDDVLAAIEFQSGGDVRIERVR